MPKTSDKIDLAMLREMCKMVSQTEFLPKYLTEQGHCTEQEITDRAFDIAMTMEQTHKQHYPETRRAHLASNNWDVHLAWHAAILAGVELIAQMRGDIMLQSDLERVKLREIGEELRQEMKGVLELAATMMPPRKTTDNAILREKCKCMVAEDIVAKYLVEQGHYSEQEIVDKVLETALAMEQTHKQHYPETRKAYILDKTKSWEGCLAWYAGKIVGAQLMAEIRGDTILQNRFHKMKSREINERMEVELTNNEMIAELMAMIMLSQI